MTTVPLRRGDLVQIHPTGLVHVVAYHDGQGNLGITHCGGAVTREARISATAPATCVVCIARAMR